MLQLSREQAEGFYTVHGSDGPDTAKTEIAYFFSEDEIRERIR